MPPDYPGSPREHLYAALAAGGGRVPGASRICQILSSCSGYSLTAKSTKPARMAVTSRETDETGNIVKLLAGSDVAKAALAAQAAERTLARRGIIAQIKTLERDHEKRRPQLESELAAAIAACKQAQAALLAAQQRANAALGAKSTASYSYSAQRDRLEQQLRESAHPALDAWCRDMRDEIDRTRKRFSYIETRQTVNPRTRPARL